MAEVFEHRVGLNLRLSWLRESHAQGGAHFEP